MHLFFMCLSMPQVQKDVAFLNRYDYERPFVLGKAADRDRGVKNGAGLSGFFGGLLRRGGAGMELTRFVRFAIMRQTASGAEYRVWRRFCEGSVQEIHTGPACAD